MTLLARFVVAVLLATAAVAALYGARIGMRSSPATRPMDRVALPATKALPVPAPLTPSPEFQQRAATPGRVPAKVAAHTTNIEITVDGSGLPLLGPNAGVATFQRENGAEFVWTPFPREASGAPTRQLTVQVSAGKSLVVTVASEARFAHHGYATKAILEAESLARGRALQLSLTTHRVELLLPQNQATAGPLQLTQVADPDWLPMQRSAGIVLHQGHRTELALGAGDYQLSAPLTQIPAQRFTVPAAAPIVLTNALAAARAGRP